MLTEKQIEYLKNYAEIRAIGEKQDKDNKRRKRIDFYRKYQPKTFERLKKEELEYFNLL